MLFAKCSFTSTLKEVNKPGILLGLLHYWARNRLRKGNLENVVQDKVSVREKFEVFHDHWNPRVVAELNGQHVKVAKFLGEFDWHSHANEDELFWVQRGELEIHLRERIVTLGTGEFFVVPRGVEHKPVAKQECQVVLFEPAATINTGDQVTERTRTELDRI